MFRACSYPLALSVLDLLLVTGMHPIVILRASRLFRFHRWLLTNLSSGTNRIDADPLVLCKRMFTNVGVLYLVDRADLISLQDIQDIQP